MRSSTIKLFRKSSKLFEPCEKIFFSHSLIDHINKFNKHNLKYLEDIEIKIINPTKVSEFSIFRTHIFNAKITFMKNNMTVYKHFYKNDLTEMFIDIDKFVKSEIKL